MDESLLLRLYTVENEEKLLLRRQWRGWMTGYNEKLSAQGTWWTNAGTWAPLPAS